MHLSSQMWAVVTTGNGGYDKLVFQQVPMPQLSDGEVLIKVLAAGINNTEINTRLGWYSSSVETGTNAEHDNAPEARHDGGWNEGTPFPFIQGTDCCGTVVAAHDPAHSALIDQRVLIRACMRTNSFEAPENIWMGSDFDGAFAQYVKVSAAEVFSINCTWSDAELATIPCSYGTAENMIHRAGITQNDRVIITGASGGVGSAAVQLCKRRGAHVTAIASNAKIDAVKSIGADVVIDGANLTNLGSEQYHVAIDNVAGDNFPKILDALKRGGRYVSSGAIAGPIVTMDMRVFYLKDLTLIGCTGWDEPIFPDLISYIEKSEIKPLLARTYPLQNIVLAQQDFLKKEHVGNFVLLPEHR